MVFNLFLYLILFANNTISLCLFFFSFNYIALYFLIPGVIVQIFNPIAELKIATEITTEEAKVEL